ncbi:MAG TPA: peptide chain release factor-like protein [Candidatus Hydrogenedentes bacterium]|nr:peptide chain release factor-like protein [Candidatus Hydrogenedentota bacterium]HOT50018.1 peptide chain release factor-like protein [Candidatus Hydrogenedentota bacterium]HOV75708.1 peptide chain release factor-like protein [Candidatus Hydrogenedentota bacterium]HPC17637.1 peptide chain release factor-like protein [Candidatus Hydrogenedentota bacterium]
MVRFGVTPRKEAELRERMDACGLREEDLDESFMSSGGPGGQKVNRSATCVRLVHRPTGIEVKMQQARSQSLNRFYARRRLCELVEAVRLGSASPASKEQARIRKQKQRRRRRARQANGMDSSA